MKNKGITLIALVITIIVLLILAGISFNALLGENGVITRAGNAKIVSELSTYKEELELFKAAKKMENGEFYEQSLTSGETTLFYNTKKDESEINIRDVIPSIDQKYLDKMEIIKGEILLDTQDKRLVELAKSLDIKTNPFIIEDGRLMSADGNLLLLDENGKLTIPETVTKIARGAFTNVDGLKTVIIPGTVKEIEAQAFMNNNSLENVIMLDGVTKIGHSAFKYCENLKSVEMPDSVTSIGADAFWYDISLTDIQLSSNLTIIPGWLFYGCQNLKNVVIPEKVQTIGTKAFNGCKSLERINLPKGLTTIEENAFNSTDLLTTIDISSENTSFKLENGVLIGNVKGDIVLILSSGISGSTFTVPNGVKILTSSLLNIYTQVTNVEIPASVTTLNAIFLNDKITRSNYRRK